MALHGAIPPSLQAAEGSFRSYAVALVLAIFLSYRRQGGFSLRKCLTLVTFVAARSIVGLDTMQICN